MIHQSEDFGIFCQLMFPSILSLSRHLCLFVVCLISRRLQECKMFGSQTLKFLPSLKCLEMHHKERVLKTKDSYVISNDNIMLKRQITQTESSLIDHISSKSLQVNFITY